MGEENRGRATRSSNESELFTFSPRCSTGSDHDKGWDQVIRGGSSHSTAILTVLQMDTYNDQPEPVSRSVDEERDMNIAPKTAVDPANDDTSSGIVSSACGKPSVMNTNSPSEMGMVHVMVQDIHGQSPVVIDQSLLCDHESTIRVHPCYWDNCTMHVAGQHKHVSEHLQRHHGVNTNATSEDTQKEPCRWLNCIHAQMKPGNIARHVLSTHIGVRWNCQSCGRPYTREDAFRRHTQEKASCQFAEYKISYENGVREIYTHDISKGWSGNQNVMYIP